MVNRAQWTFGASLMVLSLIMSPAAFAAAENVAPEKPAQAQTEDKSYLPPWMQGGGSGENAKAPANNSSTEAKSTAADEDDAAKKKSKGAAQGQKSHRHSSPQDVLFNGFAEIFGR